MIYSEQYVGSHDFVDRTIATLANKSLVPADLRLRSRIFRDNGEADTELHLLLDRVLKGKTELPEWARPDVPPPDIVFIGYPMIRLEPYIFRDHLAKCIEDTMSSRYQTTHHYPDLSISTRTWKRLVPHFSHSVAEIVTEIEAERGNTGNHFSKASRVNSVLAHNAIRAAPLYELYASNHETYLSAMHGMGDVARLSVPAALLRFAGYDDLLPDVESFEEAAAIRFTDKTRRK